MNNEKKKVFRDRASFYFKRIFPDLFKGKTLAMTIINTLATVLHTLMSVLVLKYILDLIKSGNTTNKELFIISAVYTAFYILFRSTNIVLENKSQVKFMHTRNLYMVDIVEKCMTMDFRYFEDAEFNLIINESFNGVSGDNNGYQTVLQRSFRSIPNLILVIIFSVILSYQSGIVIVVVLSSILLNFFLSSKLANYANQARPKILDEQRKYEKYKAVVDDFHFGKDIRIFDLKERLLTNINNFKNRMIDERYKVEKYRYKISFFENLSVSISDLISFAILSALTVRGSISISDLIMLLTLIVTLSNIVLVLRDDISEIMTHSTHVEKTYDFLDRNLIENDDGINKTFFGPVSIKFENVSFKYPGAEEYVFENLSFELDAGKKIALVGINGAGKTTIVKLLTGLYRPNSGKIYIDGLDADTLSQKSRFDLFSVVFQETSPLALTIAENIAGKEDDINKDKVQYTLETVGLWDKVKSFKNGLDQNVLKVLYDDGVILSGGENQKLMIARALYKKDTSVMIMDEPTSALDALAEEKIYQEFDEYMGHKTGIFISHRLASTKFCDEILFLDGGIISAKGSHDELLDKSDQYKNMYETQGKYYKESTDENI